MKTSYIAVAICFACAGIGALIASCVGVISSQYFPVFGGFIELNLAAPWSPARAALIPGHVFAFGMAGIVLGIGFGAVLTVFVAMFRKE